MFERIKHLLTGRGKLPEDGDAYVGYGYESLWNDFGQRSSSYDYYSQSARVSNPRLLNWIGSIDYSGYTRQNCLRYLIEHYQPGDENRILLRLEDWVLKVQSMARGWANRNFAQLSNEAIRQNEKLILYLSRRVKLQGDEVMEMINSDLLDRAEAMKLQEFLQFSGPFRKYLFALSLDADDALRKWIPLDPDPQNRMLLLRALDLEDLTEIEKQALQADKAPVVRRRYFYTRIKHGIQPSQEEMESMIMDSSRNVRSIAQYYLKKWHGTDAHALYKASNPPAFYYLADYARPEDEEHFLAGLNADTRRVQIDCLRALISMESSKLGDLDIGELLQRNNRMRSMLLPALPPLLTADAIRDLKEAFNTKSRRGLTSYLTLLSRKSFWLFLNEALGVMQQHSDSHLFKLIWNTVRANGSISTSPTPALREEIDAKLDALRSSKDERVTEIITELGFMMKHL